MSSISLKSIFYFVIVVVFVGCTIFLLQGMLPSDGANSDPRAGYRGTVNNDKGPAEGVADHLQNQEKPTTATTMTSALNFDVSKTNFLAENFSPKLQEAVSKNVKVEQKRIDIMGRSMFYREAVPPWDVAATNQNALLLHGMHFKSETWLDLGTIGLLAAMGHRVVAVDLPGYGETGGQQIDEKSRGEFLNEIVTSLKLDSAVVVSPSMSGSFSLPFLVNFPNKIGGYVPVAPIFTEKFTREQYEKIRTPTLIIYGELDHLLGEESTKNLRNIPNSQIQELPKAKHPAYLDQPQLFHKLLFNFFLGLKKH